MPLLPARIALLARTARLRRRRQRRATAVACTVALAALASACSDSANDATAAGRRVGAGGAELPPARVVSFVKLEALSEINGNPWTSVAELTLLDVTRTPIDRTGLTASADSAAGNDQPANAIDGNPATMWHTPWDGDTPPPHPHALTLRLSRPAKVSGFSYVARQDSIRNGTIGKYRFFVSADGVDWGQPVSSGDFGAMGPPTLEKTVYFAQQTANHAPVADAPPAQRTPLGTLASLQVSARDEDADALTYTATGLPAGLAIAPASGLISGTPISVGKYDVKIDVADSKGAKANVAFRWEVTAPPPLAEGRAPAPGEVRFVRLEEVSEVSGQPWAAVAEFNLIGADGHDLLRAGWHASADSADASDAPANAIDGNPATLWHSQWNGASPPPPHSLVIDLGAPATVRGFRYLPRQDGRSNGVLAHWRFYTSVDGVAWGSPVAEGDFSAAGPANAEKTVHLK